MKSTVKANLKYVLIFCVFSLFTWGCKKESLTGKLIVYTTDAVQFADHSNGSTYVYGIASLDVTLDGKSIGQLTSNANVEDPYRNCEVYQYSDYQTVFINVLPADSHQLRVFATRRNGALFDFTLPPFKTESGNCTLINLPSH